MLNLFTVELLRSTLVLSPWVYQWFLLDVNRSHLLMAGGFNWSLWRRRWYRWSIVFLLNGLNLLLRSYFFVSWSRNSRWIKITFNFLIITFSLLLAIFPIVFFLLLLILILQHYLVLLLVFLLFLKLILNLHLSLSFNFIGSIFLFSFNSFLLLNYCWANLICEIEFNLIVFYEFCNCLSAVIYSGKLFKQRDQIIKLPVLRVIVPTYNWDGTFRLEHVSWRWVIQNHRIFHISTDFWHIFGKYTV